MPKIQEMIEKIPSPRTGAICNEKTGWLPAGFDMQVRQIMSNCIKELLRNHYRKGQIHAELDSVDNVVRYTIAYFFKFHTYVLFWFAGRCRC